MAKFNKLQNNFKSGQLSQLLDGRTDLNEYQNGLKTMKNAYPMRQGGAQKRAGSKMIADLTSSIVDNSLKGNAMKMIPFSTSDGDDYIFILIADRRLGATSGNLLLKKVNDEFIDVTSTQFDAANSIVSGASNDTLKNIHWADYGNEVFFARGYNEITYDITNQESFAEPAVLYATYSDNGNDYIPVWKFHTLDQFLLDAKPTASFTFNGYTDIAASVITSTAHGLVTGQRVTYGGANIGLTDGTEYFVIRLTDDTFQLADTYLNSLGPTPTPKTLSAEGSPGTTQNIYPSSIATTSVDREQLLARPYLPTNINANVSIDVADATLGSGKTFTTTSAYFTKKHEGSFFRIDDLSAAPSKELVFKVDTYTDETTVTGTIVVTNSSAGIFLAWREAAWSNERGWPGTVTTYEGRLVYGGTKTQPGKIWFSATEDITVFMQDVLKQDYSSDVSLIGYPGNGANPTPTNAKEYGFTDNIGKRISFVNSGRALEVGTNKDVKVFNASEGVGVGTPFFTIESQTGSAAIQPARAEQSTLYSETLIGVSNFTLDTEIETRDRYISKQLSLLNEEIIEGDVELFYYDSFKKILYIVLKVDGEYILRGLYFDTIDDTAAWFTFDFNDYVNLSDVYSVTGFDESPHVYMLITRRQVSGVAQVYLEKLEGATTKLLESDLDYLDSHLNGDASGTNEISGLDHLYQLKDADGNDVTLTAIGNLAGESPERPIVFRNLTVNYDPAKIGAEYYVTLPSNVDEYVIGIPYTSELETMLIDGGLNVEGSSQGQIKRVDQVTLRMWNTTNLEIGDSESIFPVKFDDDSLYTGDKVIKFDQGPRTDNRIKVVSSDPKPMFLTSLIAKGVGYE